MLHVFFSNFYCNEQVYKKISKKTTKIVCLDKCNNDKCEKEYCIQGCWKFHCSGCGRGILEQDICQNIDCFYSTIIQENLHLLLDVNNDKGKTISLKSCCYSIFCKEDLLNLLKLIKKNDPSYTVSGCLIDYRGNM
jgi:hypothetical protein